MTLEEFRKCMEMLKAYYVTWPFDTNNASAVSLWYLQFRNVSGKEMSKLIQGYATTHMYGPQSPYALLEPYRKLAEQQMPNAVQAMSGLISIVNSNVWKYDYCENLNGFLNRVPEGAAKKAFKDLTYQFQCAGHRPFSDERLVKAFTERYNEYLKEDIEEKMKEIMDMKPEERKLMLESSKEKDEIRRSANELLIG